MKKTAVYLLVVLLLSALGLTFVPIGSSQTSQTQNVKILGQSYYFDEEGLLDVVGLVQNVGNSTVNPVFLTGVVYGPGDTYESSSYTQVWASYLTPGQEAPYYMEFYPPQNSNGWLSSYVSNITLAVSMANSTSSYEYQDLKIISSKGSIGTTGGYSGAYVVNGVIENTGTVPATNVTVVGAFFNSTGSVVGVGYTDYLTPQVLVPGNTTTFEIGAFDLNQSIVPASLQIHSYQLLVQTELPILNESEYGPPPAATIYQGTGTSSSTSSASSTSSTSSSSSSAKSGVNSKNSSIDTIIYVVVIAVVIVAVAAAAALLVLRRSKPQQTVKEARKAKKQRAR